MGDDIAFRRLGEEVVDENLRGKMDRGEKEKGKKESTDIRE